MLGSRTFAPGPLRGEARVPGDKSISHRAAIAAACAQSAVHIANLNPGDDVRATVDALAALGVRVEPTVDTITVEAGRLCRPPAAIDCMNSGSTARMLLGVCAGANVAATFDGDASLRRRPMEPVAAQLRAFGAQIETTQGHAPVRLTGTPRIETRNFILLGPSAQVKSALLFAAAFAGVSITIAGDGGSRDHTERLFRHLGADIEWDGRRIALGSAPLDGGSVNVAGDFSAAAFFITAAAITPGSAIWINGVGVNPTRTGLLDALLQMGARIGVRNPRTASGEPVADLSVEHAPLRSIGVGADLALRAIDEIPLLAIAAAFAEGITTIAGVRDLRSKESDRLAAIERLLSAAGIPVTQQPNAVTIAGGSPSAPDRRFETHDDHRIAMAAAVLACAAGPISVDGAASVGVSFPSFTSVLEGLRGSG